MIATRRILTRRGGNRKGPDVDQGDHHGHMSRSPRSHTPEECEHGEEDGHHQEGKGQARGLVLVELPPGVAHDDGEDDGGTQGEEAEALDRVRYRLIPAVGPAQVEQKEHHRQAPAQQTPAQEDDRSPDESHDSGDDEQDFHDNSDSGTAIDGPREPCTRISHANGQRRTVRRPSKAVEKPGRSDSDGLGRPSYRTLGVAFSHRRVANRQRRPAPGAMRKIARHCRG